MNEQDLTADDFADFFRDVHGNEPFPWQQRLTVQVLSRGAWPPVMDLPTGTGKTAVLDTAVFAMAACPATAPRRVVFVIDRRIVVDQVHERARLIRRQVQQGNTPVLRRVREGLQKLGDGEPLGVAALRGGVPLDNDWAHRPDQPWVMVSTVDQFGSRLLFRGYGVSFGMRPIHAGLAGNDCLVILDEVHLSVPFAETLKQVSGSRSTKLPQRFAVVEMSATPSNTEVEPFRLEPADLETCAELRRRVCAAKEAQLVEVRDLDALPAAALKIVRSMETAKPHKNVRSIGIVVNRVRTARETCRTLQAAGYTTFLITGRMRPLDRVDVLDEIGPALDPDGERGADELTVVVATQAIEVGADFSFDALITECAAVDSLRQRFGRLDRRGLGFDRTGAPTDAWIIGLKSVIAAKKPDPVYGDSVKVTWEELQHRARDGRIDVGPRSLTDFPEAASAPRTHAPLLLDTHLEAWTQTRPEPLVQPAVEPFLHGIDHQQTAEVSILWRHDRSPDVLRLVPPRSAEFLQVPIDAARSWLSGGAEVEVVDVTQQPSADGHERSSATPPVATDWVRWGGFAAGAEPIGVDEIRPGDVLIVAPGLGGLGAGTWDPSASETVTDLGDAAQLAHGGRVTLRLDPHVLGSGSPPSPADETESDAPASERIAQWLGQWMAEFGDQHEWVSAVARKLGSNFELTPVHLDQAGTRDSYYVLSERDSRTGKPVVDATTMDGSDECGSMTGTGVTLRRHLDGVGERARRFAKSLDLATELVEDLHLAARLHDIGKVDRRFQSQLAGGDPVALEMLEEPLAKSLPAAPRVQRYPTGMRHEVASVAMIESSSAVLVPAHDQDLVLHLVGTHHGWGRPLPPIVEDPDPQTLRYTFDGYSLEACSDLVASPLALDMADRFWRLVERYGYHGLAWLEAILRLADHQQSAEEAAQR